MVEFDLKLVGELPIDGLNNLANTVVQTAQMGWQLHFLIATGNGMQAYGMLLGEVLS